MAFWLKFLIAVGLVEAVVTIVAEAEIFEGIRVRLDGKGEEPRKIGVFSRCWYCQSVWAGWGAAYLLGLMGVFDWMGWFEPLLWGLLAHRVSNIWHEAVSRYLDRAPLALFLRSWRRDEGVEVPKEGEGEDGAV